MKRTKSLIFKIGSFIVLTQIVALIGLGFFYISRFGRELNVRFENQIKTPAQLMTQGQLRYESAGNRATMQKLVGDSLAECMLIGANHKIYYSINSQYIFLPPIFRTG